MDSPSDGNGSTMAPKEKTTTGSIPVARLREEAEQQAIGRRILLVDDSPTVHEFVRGALPGNRVDRLASFVDLPAYLRDGEPSVVILDIEMPGISGQAFARFLRRCTQTDIPIILYSSVEENRLAAVGVEVGARVTLKKSRDSLALRKAVESLLPGAASS